MTNMFGCEENNFKPDIKKLSLKLFYFNSNTDSLP